MAVVAPAATETLGGTEATAALPLVNVMAVPPAGGWPVRRTVLWVLDFPPVIWVGESGNDSNCAGCTVRVAVFVTPL